MPWRRCARVSRTSRACGVRRARRCLDTLVTLGRYGDVSDPAGLGLARLLLGQNGPGELDAFIESQVGPVLAYDARRGTGLVATLEAWFAAGSRPAETAKQLHVHPNTVAQRLDRVGTLLGDDWRDPARGLDVCSWRCGSTGLRQAEPTPDRPRSCAPAT